MQQRSRVNTAVRNAKRLSNNSISPAVLIHTPTDHPTSPVKGPAAHPHQLSGGSVQIFYLLRAGTLQYTSFGAGIWRDVK